MNNSVDIRPKLGDILNGYQRLSYRPETAIAEFVDNSTASYYENQALFDILGETLFIDIVYDPSQSVLEITDNAWGMDRQTFADALTIAKRPQKQGGRNEYGMGMKTAASWFGKKWTVITKTSNSNEEYTATVDINALMNSNENEINIVTKVVEDDSHYTKVLISDLSRRIQDRTLTKLIGELSSIYRSDINSGKITIRVNGMPLSYDIPEILTETLDGIEKTWRKDFSDYIIFDGVKYDFNGFVALRKIGNYKETGFALLRRGRVIVGGSDKNFKPSEIFGASNSFQSLRIFGEVHMDTWPVTQAKDAFDWDLDGLKEAFIERLREIVEEYIDKAKRTRKKEKEEFVQVTIKDVREIAEKTHEDLSNINEIDVESKSQIEISEVTDANSNVIPSYMTSVKILNKSYSIKVSFISDITKELISVNEIPETHVTEVIFNTSHPYFEEIKDQEAFIKVFQKYLILHVVAEKYLTHVSTNKGMVYPFEVRETINRMLEEIKANSDNEIFS